MISLGGTRAELLAEIDAPNLPGDPLSDLTDVHAASEDAYVRVCGRARDELFPLLKIALSERFAAAPRLQVIRVYPARGCAGDDCGNRYVLRLAGRNGRPAETRILTGCLHPTEAAAASD